MARSPAAYFLSLLGLATTSLAWDKGCTVLAEKFPNKTSLPGTSEYKSEVSCMPLRFGHVVGQELTFRPRQLVRDLCVSCTLRF